jgi:hypothetical protein
MAKNNIEFQLQDQQQAQSTPSSRSRSQHRRDDDNDELGEEYEVDGEYGGTFDERQNDLPAVAANGLGKSHSAMALGNRPNKSNLSSMTMRRVQSVGPDVLIPPKNHRNISPPQSPSNRHALSNSMKRTAAGRLRGTVRQNKSQQEITKDLEHEIKALQKQLNSLESTKYEPSQPSYSIFP